jgi:hypothetical protein
MLSSSPNYDLRRPAGGSLNLGHSMAKNHPTSHLNICAFVSMGSALKYLGS